MVDFDLSILNNPELGKAANTPFLDEIEAQANENAAALAENRESRKVAPRERFGIYAGRVDNGPLKFEDGTPIFLETNLNDYFQDAELARVALSQKVANEFEKEDENQEAEKNSTEPTNSTEES